MLVSLERCNAVQAVSIPSILQSGCVVKVFVTTDAVAVIARAVMLRAFLHMMGLGAERAGIGHRFLHARHFKHPCGDVKLLFSPPSGLALPAPIKPGAGIVG